MLCQHCFKKTATVNVTQVVGGEKKELNLCADCAENLGLQKAISNLPQIFTGLMMNILKEKDKQSSLPVRQTLSERCPFCNYSWDDFKRTGLLGCDHCYSSFYDQIKEVLRRIHGSTKHIGFHPRQETVDLFDQNLSFLEWALQEALVKEDYEKAAELRDKIRTLKQKTE